MPQPFRSRVRRYRPHRSRGQSLVEFALVLPVLMIVLLFAIDFGRAFYSWVILQNASRIGANYASLNPELWETNPTVVPTVYSDLISKDWGAIDCDAPTAPLFVDSPGDTSSAGQTPDTSFDVGDSVRVTLTCPFRPLTPIISGILGNSIQLVATSEFRIRSGDIAGLDNDLQIPKPSTTTPSPVPTATPTSGPTPTPTPPPTPPPCLVVPNLALEAGGPETVAQARAEWQAAGFTGAFLPNGQNNRIVTGQNQLVGVCLPAATAVTVTHS